MITAINCGDDTDCTAATVGATLGILGGTAAIPADWKAHIGDEIVTISIDRGGACRRLPATCTELTERVTAQTPHMLFENDAYVAITDGKDEIPENIEAFIAENCKQMPIVEPYSMHFDFTFASADVVLDGAPEIAPLGERKVRIVVSNNYGAFDGSLYNLTLRWWLPDGFSAEGGRKAVVLPRKDSHNDATCAVEFTLRAGESVNAVNRCVLEIVGEGRITPMYIPITLLG